MGWWSAGRSKCFPLCTAVLLALCCQGLAKATSNTMPLALNSDTHCQVEIAVSLTSCGAHDSCLVSVFCRHQKSIVATLRDADVSIRRRGLDLLFTMCNHSNAPEIVDELLKYLNVADFSMRDELVLKTAVLAERYGCCCAFSALFIPQHRAGTMVCC